MTVKEVESTSRVQEHADKELSRHALIEIESGESIKRMVVPYTRRKDIEKWFYDTGSNSDYVFETDNTGEPHSMVRISRSASEIRFAELTKSRIIRKNLEYIFLSNIPTLISFVTTLLLVGFVWAYTAVNAFLKHEKITSELMEPARSSTVSITTVFLVLYAIILSIKTFRVIKDKYYAIREDFEVSFISSLAVNSFLVALISLLGIEKLYDIIISLLF